MGDVNLEEHENHASSVLFRKETPPDELETLVSLQKKLMQAGSVQERNAILDNVPAVQTALDCSEGLARFIQNTSLFAASAIKQLVIIGQGLNLEEQDAARWEYLAKQTIAIDEFYREMGGIIGYQVSILQLLQKKEDNLSSSEQFHSPNFIDISALNDEVIESIRAGLEAMPILAELYPLGGSADRLHLVDQETGLELPAAKLEFGGRTLLESLIRDLFARERLYYSLFGLQITTPIAIMTSYEKDNYRHVLKICEDNQWFGRPKESFRFFVQPLVPAVDEKGNWFTIGSCKLLLKPGGHGAIWKLARDKGVFTWLKSLGAQKALIRQINNPIAGLDYGLISFVGIGTMRNMSFGFSSCPRRVFSAEGIVVLKEAQDRIVLTNIEYCDFLKKGIRDEPGTGALLDQYSRFTSNTNILFADLNAVEQAVASHPFPGLLMNLKKGSILDESGIEQQGLVGRLESTMQNIADAFDEPKTTGLEPTKTFVTYNLRHKTISVAKKAYLPGVSFLETPEHCFYELLKASRELLHQCGFILPKSFSMEEMMLFGPDCAFVYHPALGPLYSIIGQKLRGGQISLGSELLLEIAEIDAEELVLDGSFQIKAGQILGAFNSDGLLQFGRNVGRCILRNVRVQNRGVAWNSPFWKMAPDRKESVEVFLKGNSLFDARNIVFQGSHRFVVEDGIHMIVRQKDGKITINEEQMREEPLWKYSWENGVDLKSDRRSAAL